MTELRHVISILTIPIYFLVAGVLYRRNLWRSYLFFWICLIVEGTALAGTELSSRKTSLMVYLISQPIMWVVYVMMVVEVFRKVFDRYPGISRVGQRFVLVSMLIAFAVALASIGGDLGNGWSGISLVVRYSVIFRTITSALTIYMILIAGFLVWMPMPLAPNTIRHAFLFFFYFIIITGTTYFLNTSPPSFIRISNLIVSILTLGALLSWLALLRADGEMLPSMAPAPRTATGVLLGRLESLNSSLSGAKE